MHANGLQYYLSPRKQSVILGAKELDNETIMTTDAHRPHSVNINLRYSIHDSRN